MRTLSVIWLAVLLFPASVMGQEKQQGDNWMRAGYVALGAVSFADIELTGRAIERGLVERNPIYKPFVGTPGAIGLVNGAISASVGLGAYSLHKKGKRKEAKIVIWVWTAVRGLVVAHNIRELRR